MDKPWFVYVLGSLSVSRTYVGCTNDVARRVRQHNGEIVGGARCTRSCRPWELLKVYGPYSGRSEAQSVEYRVKKLRGLNRTRWEPSITCASRGRSRCCTRSSSCTGSLCSPRVVHAPRSHTELVSTLGVDAGSQGTLEGQGCGTDCSGAWVSKVKRPPPGEGWWAFR